MRRILNHPWSEADMIEHFSILLSSSQGEGSRLSPERRDLKYQGEMMVDLFEALEEGRGCS